MVIPPFCRCTAAALIGKCGAPAPRREERRISPRARETTWARKGQRQRKRNEEAEFGVAGGHGAFPYVSGPGMKLSDRGGRPSEAGADGGMGRSTIAGALLRPRRPAAQAAGWLTE